MMSSVDQINGMNEIVDAVVIVLIIAKNHQNIQHQTINRNHHQMIVHLVQSKATFHHRTINEINDHQHYQMMQMVGFKNYFLFYFLFTIFILIICRI